APDRPRRVRMRSAGPIEPAPAPAPAPLAHSCREAGASCVLPVDPAPVLTAGHFGDPVGVVEIPAHRLFKRSLEALSRPPAEFALELGRIYGIAPVVSGPVFHEADLVGIRPAVRA